MVVLCSVHHQVILLQRLNNTDKLLFRVYQSFICAFSKRLPIIHGEVPLPHLIYRGLVLTVLKVIDQFEDQFLLLRINLVCNDRFSGKQSLNFVLLIDLLSLFRRFVEDWRLGYCLPLSQISGAWFLGWSIALFLHLLIFGFLISELLEDCFIQHFDSDININEINSFRETKFCVSRWQTDNRL